MRCRNNVSLCQARFYENCTIVSDLHKIYLVLYLAVQRFYTAMHMHLIVNQNLYMLHM